MKTTIDVLQNPNAGEDLSIPLGRIKLHSLNWFRIDECEPLSDLAARFRSQAEAFAALVMRGAAPTAVISRDALGQHLSHPFGNALFLHRPIQVTVEHWSVPMLLLPETEPLSTVIRLVLSRPPAFRYEPVVMRRADQSCHLVDAYDLLLEQCTQLTGTLVELRTQRAATLASEKERETLQKQLIDASRLAGRAEVATGVLHNVGNVLNSVNVSVSMIQRTLDSSKLSGLGRTLELLASQGDRLGEFFAGDKKSKHVVPFLQRLFDTLKEEQSTHRRELSQLSQSVEHIKQVVQMQQGYAKSSTFIEPVRPASIVEEALRINMVSFDRHNVKVTCEFEDLPPLPLDKHKLLQVLVNLISNAKNATKHQPVNERRIHIQIDTPAHDGAEWVRYRVTDNGIGIPEENLTRIFGHGFTTRSDGNGFGLHSSANAAKEMGGSLNAASEGAGHGATFTLEIPIAQQQLKAA